MGTHHGGDSGNRPQDGDHPPENPRFVSGLPPEWGDIQIPDDPSALADEAERIRQELAEREREREREQIALSHLANRRARRNDSSVGVPLVIMSIAVMITLVSLFAMAWTGPGNPGRVDPAPEQAAEHLPDLTLSEAGGQPVTLSTRLPVVLLLVEECADCAELIAATAAAAPPGVTVAAVGHQAPADPPATDTAGSSALLLADPEQRLRTALGLGAPINAATVVLVNEHGEVVQRVPSATTVGQFQADLAELGTT